MKRTGVETSVTGKLLSTATIARLGQHLWSVSLDLLPPRPLSPAPGGGLAAAHQGRVPVEAVGAEVGHGGLVAVVLRERRSLRQEPLHLVVGPRGQGDDLSH